MISNSQGVSTNGGSSMGSASMNSIGPYDPGDVRDAMPAPLWRFTAAIQIRK